MVKRLFSKLQVDFSFKYLQDFYQDTYMFDDTYIQISIDDILTLHNIYCQNNDDIFVGKRKDEGDDDNYTNLQGKYN